MRINYNQVIRQANSIDSQARQLESEIKKLETLLHSIGSRWEGPASVEYRKKISKLITNMRNTKNDMSNAASLIKNVANKIKREDEKQAELARNLAALNAAKNRK